MGFLDRLFQSTPQIPAGPDIRFGRYSDSYKRPENYQAWDHSLEAFENGNYLDSYRLFFRYLRDDIEDNVHWWDEGEGIAFELYQGSKKITGYADAQKLKAEAKVAASASLNVGFMRRLIEKNFELSYSRFALDEDNNITILFDTYTLDGSPYKLYYALKEVATNADKQDDLLLEEFKGLQQVNNTHLVDLPDAEKGVKYQFLQRSITTVMQEFDAGKLPRDQYPGAYAYLILQLLYKLDYLIKPEGYTMETLERLHRQYFATDQKSILEKSQQILRELRKLNNRSREEFFREIYRVKSTFGITLHVNHDRVASFIENEMANFDWYLDNGYPQFAQAIPSYIAGFCLFNYATPQPDRDLFHLYFQIIEAEYFQQLGFKLDYVDPASQTLQKKNIKRAIEQIVENNKARYSKMRPATGILDYSSLTHFSKSFMLMMKDLDLTSRF
ncbi:MAG: hypothetical protein H6555_08480 [Lewinellaceae bacterium]|nr:hypothetical protein [Lewinellaceae bacterium]